MSASQEARPVTPPNCAICLEDIAPETTARLVPCNHEFDLKCATTLLQGFGQTSQKCPLCRTPVEEVRFDFREGGTYSSHRPLAEDDNSGSFLREDERILLGMSEEERNMRLELRRLRRLNDYDPAMWRLIWVATWAKEDEKFHFLSRALSLKVLQRNEDGKVLTVCFMTRSLTLKADSELPPVVGKARPEEVEKARAEAKKIVDSFGIKRPFTELSLEEPERRIGRDSRGIKAATAKSIDIEQAKEEIIINESVTLHESYPTPPTEEQSQTLDDSEKAENERAVKLARQEIQGALEVLKEYGEFHDFRDLERSCTGVMEPVLEEDLECEYCEERHRNGDCRLPWDLTVVE